MKAKKSYISKKAKVHPGVKLGKSVFVDDFVILGYPISNLNKQPKTVIGNGAVIRSHTVIYSGNIIGNNFQTGHNVLIREDNKIGDKVSIGSGSCVEHHVTLENNVRIHSGAFIPEHSMLEEGVWIGPNVVITNVLHPLCAKAKTCAKGANIKRGAKIGANTTLCPDIIVGEGALVGAGSVVTNNVGVKKVVCGNPARVIKDVDSLSCRYGLVTKPY